MREKYESLALVQLKELAKVRGLKGTSTMKKADLVEAMLAEDERLKKEEEAKAAEEKQEAAKSEEAEKPERTERLSDRRGITDRTDMIDRIEMTETIGQTVPSVRIVQNALTVPKPVQRWSA
jgi:transcription termination factor Rho